MSKILTAKATFGDVAVEIVAAEDDFKCAATADQERQAFRRRPIAAAKNLINQVSLPSADHLLGGLTSSLTALLLTSPSRSWALRPAQSGVARTRQRSPEVRSTAFPARPPDLPVRHCLKAGWDVVEARLLGDPI
jgi:hypothetical protein